MGLTLVTPPATEPITTAELKAHLRIDTSSEDAYLDSLITTARAHVEARVNRALITQTWDIWMDLEPTLQVLRIPYPPLQSITHIKYYTPADVETLYASTNYRVDTTDSQGGRVGLVEGHGWPTDIRYNNSIVVRFVAGYGDASAVPAQIKHAIKLLAAHWYENREPVNVGNITSELAMMLDSLLWPFKVFRI